ncbi:MAG: putative repeat protein (TIGR01451 family) [Crocinitomix sp.]|jgi:uncharacterized repeat protein (TIGR01451 family)
MKNLLLLTLTLFISTYGHAQFSPFNDVTAGEIYNPYELIPIDFDMDGDMDIVGRTWDYLFWQENLGLGEMSASVIIFIELETQDFAIADFDSDGDNDIVVSNNGWLTRLLLNDGEEEFEETDLPEIMGITLFKIVDFDGDGNLDIVGTKFSEIVWLEGDGTGAIIAEHELETDVIGYIDFILSDIDVDGDYDILWCSNFEEGAVYIIENLGGGVFGDRVLIDEGMTNPSSVYTTDVDGDGDLDILYGSWAYDDGGFVYWNENMGGGIFGASTLISDDHVGEINITAGDIDLDGDYDIVVSSFEDNKVVWYENTGDASFEAADIMAVDIFDARDVELADFDNDGDLDVYAVGNFLEKIGWFENTTLAPTYAEGFVYYDENENGVMDIDEVGLASNMMLSDPDATAAMTYADGSYAVSFIGLPDGVYEIYPILDYWEITSPYESYEVLVSDDFVILDTLDFGLIPDEIVNEIGTDITGSDDIRCSSLARFWLSVNNMGTTFPSGVMCLELDDSLNYFSAEIVPDSIVGQNIYWSYDELFYFDVETFSVIVSTPDGADDTVNSILTSTILEFDEVVFTAIDSITQIVTCAYDPNDKTPDPMGEGSEGNIPASTEWIEYTICFQNTGTDYAEDVLIRDQLDENLIWTSIQPLYSSHDMEFEFDPSGEVAFVFNDIILPDSTTNEIESHGFVKYRIKLKPDLAIGTTIENTAHIYFDYNPAVITNTALNTIAEFTDVSIPLLDNIVNVNVYPNPADDFVYVTMVSEKELSYTIRMYNLVGQLVYQQEKMTSGQTQINTSQFDQGLYLLEIEAIEDGSKLYTTKLIIE